MTRKLHIFIIILMFLSSCAQKQSTQAVDYYKLYSINGEYEEIRDELVDAIEDRGLVISFISHAAKMLERTQSMSKIKGNLYANGEVLLFCKANLSHQLAATDVHSLILCPQAIAIYTLKKEPEIVYMSIRKTPKNVKAYKPIFQLLSGIIEQVIEENE